MQKTGQERKFKNINKEEKSHCTISQKVTLAEPLGLSILRRWKLLVELRTKQGSSWILVLLGHSQCNLWMQSLISSACAINLFFLLSLLRGRHRHPLLPCTPNSLQNLAEVRFYPVRRGISLARPLGFALTFLCLNH